MADIIVAVACNLVAALILISGIFSAISNGVKVTLVKLFLMVSGGVGAYFLTPVISDKLYAVDGVSAFLKNEIGGGISKGTVNSCIFLVWFLLFYAVTLIICSIVKHIRIKRLRNKKLNSLKMKRAKSINPRAEKAAKRAEWKALKFKYKEKVRWCHRLISGFLGAIIAIVVGYVVIMPYGYIAKDINYKGDKEYLEKGYEYTLNGLIGDDISNFLVDVKSEVSEENENESEDDSNASEKDEESSSDENNF